MDAGRNRRKLDVRRWACFISQELCWLIHAVTNFDKHVFAQLWRIGKTAVHRRIIWSDTLSVQHLDILQMSLAATHCR